MNVLPAPIHPFPARMAPEIVIRALDKLQKRQATVLDPMAGSGTTLVAAKARGHIAIGFDTDPLAVLIARAWSGHFFSSQLRVAAERVLQVACRLYGTGSRCQQYPAGADSETRLFIQYWFDETNRRQLAALSKAIRTERNPRLRDLLWCGLSRLIIAKKHGASLASDLSHSRPHRSVVQSSLRPLDAFRASIEHILSRISLINRPAVRNKVKVELGDARRLAVPSRSVDLVLTSPPYLNAIDYLRGHKFSLVWMGWPICKLRQIRAGNVGSQVGVNQALSALTLEALNSLGNIRLLPIRHQRIIQRYVCDMQQVVFEIARVLKPGGWMVLVVGESCWRGVPLRNSRAICTLATAAGLRRQNSHRRVIPPSRRYLPPPRNQTSGSQLQQRMDYETVITFKARG